MIAGIQDELTLGSGGGGASNIGNTHRYWRLYFTETGTQGNICTLGDIEFRESVGGDDVIGEATMSAPFTDYGPIANATDGNAVTFWGTNQDLGAEDVYIQADFGEGNEKWINEFAINSRTVSGAQGYRGFRLEWSDDATNWTTEATYSGESTWGNDELRVYAGGPQHVLIGEVADISDFPTTHTAGQFLRRNLADDGYDFTDPPGISAEALGRHRYWRLRGTVAGSYNGGVVGSLEFYEHDGGANVATVSGNQIGGVGSSGNAFDGNLAGNPWIGAGGSVATGESWVGYDFGAGNEVNIRSFELSTRSSPNQNQIWDEWNLDYSDDGVNWFTKQSYVDASSWSAAENRIYYVDENTNLGDIDDVDLTTTAPADGDGLVWDNANSKWIPRGISMKQTEITATSYSTVNADFAGSVVRRMNNASAITVTVEPGMVGDQPCTFIQTGAGTVSFAAGSGVVINSLDSNLDIAGQYGSATLIPDVDNSNTYFLVGALA